MSLSSRLVQYHLNHVKRKYKCNLIFIGLGTRCNLQIYLHARYLSCSADSQEGFCGNVDTTCSAINTCRTCNTFSAFGGKCVEIDEYPNATIAEYGTYSLDAYKIKAEIFARGPVAAGINAEPIIDYHGGVYTDDNPEDKGINHIVSIVGWGLNETSQKQHWIIRNSWGEYWGE